MSQSFARAHNHMAPEQTSSVTVETRRKKCKPRQTRPPGVENSFPLFSTFGASHAFPQAPLHLVRDGRPNPNPRTVRSLAFQVRRVRRPALPAQAPPRPRASPTGRPQLPAPLSLARHRPTPPPPLHPLVNLAPYKAHLPAYAVVRHLVLVPPIIDRPHVHPKPGRHLFPR